MTLSVKSYIYLGKNFQAHCCCARRRYQRIFRIILDPHHYFILKTVLILTALTLSLQNEKKESRIIFRII